MLNPPVVDSALPIPAGQGWHSQSSDDVLRALGVDARGLDDAVAASRAASAGPNELDERGGKALWRLFADQFANVMVLILAGAAGLSLALGKWPEALAVIAIVLLFAVLGCVQEYRAERAIDALRRLAVPTVRVLRQGRAVTVSARGLVPGDVVLLEAGNIVPADMRLLHVADLRIAEAALTGESEPSEKGTDAVAGVNVQLGDRTSMVYMGTVVAHGRGSGVVVATGMRTELGKIAGLLQVAGEETTPLQRQLDGFGRQLAAAGGIVAGLVLVMGVLLGEAPAEMLLAAISVAVAVVPEGLPAVVTFTLAIGAQRMLRRNVLIRRLPAVETLGSVTVICTDKTGTLTENRMTAVTADLLGRRIALDGQARHGSGVPDVRADPAFNALLVGGVLCNDGHLEEAEGGAWHAVGDPTETALLVPARHAGITRPLADAAMPRVGELPFDSGRKRMTTVHRVMPGDAALPVPPVWSDDPYVAVTKGAPDRLLTCASSAWIDGRAVALTEEIPGAFLAASDEMAAEGMRVLGLAFRPLQGPDVHPGIESGLTLVGLFGIIDPPRAEVRTAIARCQAAGIRPVMITGDHPLTAASIARDLGIVDSRQAQAVTGAMMDEMDEAEVERQAGTSSIFARVSPAQKFAIIRALKARGEVVAMTGDGVNDAPALKDAHIGVAMGITGTDVSKDASDMILRDDNFASIVAAVEEGRVVYDNLRRFLAFAVAGNVGKVAVMLCWPLPFVALGLPLESPVALVPLQLLWLNLMTDGVLGVSMGLEPAERDVMSRPPRRPGDSLLSGGFGWHAVTVGAVIGAVTLGVGVAYHTAGAPQWQTVMFTTLALLQVFQAFASRSATESLWRVGFWSNRGLVVAAGVVVTLQFAVLYSPVGAVMGLEPLAPGDVLLCVGLGVVPLLGTEAWKAWRRRRRADRDGEGAHPDDARWCPGCCRVRWA